MIAGQHLLGLEGMTADQIHGLLDMADGFQKISRRTIKRVPSLRGRTVLTAFFEPSTRTRVSFDLAAKRLSADGVGFAAGGSSVSKGESLLDTARTLDAMQCDAVIIRHNRSGAPHFLANHLKARIVNAGDGMHEHPTQGLLDMKTIRDRFRRLEGLEVAIIGDIAHSRVARSNLIGLSACGANVRIAGPGTLLPRELARAYGCTICDSVPHALEGAHVIMALRLQRERMSAGFLPSLREYAIEYGINAELLELARPEAILMHPGPVNRGVELSPDIVYSDRSVVLDQVENGVAVRCAVLFAILGGDSE